MSLNSVFYACFDSRETDKQLPHWWTLFGLSSYSTPLPRPLVHPTVLSRQRVQDGRDAERYVNMPFLPSNTATSPLLYLAGSWLHSPINFHKSSLYLPSHLVILVKYAEDLDGASL